MDNNSGDFMKGFIRIIEAIIASIIILTSLSFFIPPLTSRNGWDYGISEIKLEDAIFSLHLNGSIAKYVKDNNATGLRVLLENFIGRSSDFSVEIVGIPNPIIYTGCVCSDAEFSELKSHLGASTGGNLSFYYKERQIEIRLERVSPTNTNSNILLFMNMDSLNSNYTDPNIRNSMIRFLENGGTVMLIGDITQTQTSNKASREIFNISWSLSIPASSGRFSEYSNFYKISYNIAKYYSNLTGISPSQAYFQNFNTISKIAINNNTIIEDNTKSVSFVVGNKNIVNGNGRALWIAGSDWSDEIKNLTKASMMWASGEKYKMDISKKTVPRTSQKASIIIYDLDSYEFIVTSWRIF